MGSSVNEKIKINDNYFIEELAMKRNDEIQHIIDECNKILNRKLTVVEVEIIVMAFNGGVEFCINNRLNF